MSDTLKVYAYKNCDTCRKALRYLDARGIPHDVIPIRETPPTKAELRRMLDAYHGDVRKMFSTSGVDYKRLHLKDKLSGMPVDEALNLLHENGNLVRRPFVLGTDVAMVGFREVDWDRAIT